jgi:predicted dehydrogenase
MIRFGVIGYGYWGPNIVRNIQALTTAKVVAICDKSEKNLKRAASSNPNVGLLTTDSDMLMRSTEIDAIAVVTPVWTHYELAKQAMLNGKHVFIEKPFTSTSQQGEELINLAEQKNLTIMVDHTFLFTGAVRKIKQLVDDNALGKLYYYDSTRVNLGLFQHDVNVLWDLAPHDLSIIDHVIGREPEAIVATGEAHVNKLADVAYLTLYYPEKVIAHVCVNWLSPVKVRSTLIGGEKKMLVWNDLEVDEKIKIYDRGVNITAQEGVYEAMVSYRSGDMWSPKVESTEALKLEMQYFAECVESAKRPFNDGRAGLRVVKMLEAAEVSLQKSREAMLV